MRTVLMMLLLIVTACGPTLKKLPLSPRFAEKEVIGISNDERLQEASGLAISFSNPGHFWTHNDSGGEPAVYLINEHGELLLTANLTGAQNLDWEDMAIARDGSGFLYIGDIGDNLAIHENRTIYRIQEPKFDGRQDQPVSFEKMMIQYEEGPRDSETLMWDPFTKNLILLTKREENIMVYAFPFEAKATMTISSQGTMDLTQLTAGDINANGDVLIKSYDQVFYLENNDKTPIVDLLLGSQPQLIDYEVEKQGEALTWSEDGQSFFLLSEWNDNLPQPFYKYF